MESRAADAGIKVADFGLSRNLLETPNLFNCAGTPGYIGMMSSFTEELIVLIPFSNLAPEILEAYYHKIPYGKTVDMWSVGVILYIL